MTVIDRIDISKETISFIENKIKILIPKIGAGNRKTRKKLLSEYQFWKNKFENEKKIIEQIGAMVDEMEGDNW